MLRCAKTYRCFILVFLVDRISNFENVTFFDYVEYGSVLVYVGRQTRKLENGQYSGRTVIGKVALSFVSIMCYGAIN